MGGEKINKMDSKFVYYVSYGSNLSVDRFMKYIQGGSPKGSHISHPVSSTTLHFTNLLKNTRKKGWRDKSAPKHTEIVKIQNFEMSFSKYSDWWKVSDDFSSQSLLLLKYGNKGRRFCNKRKGRRNYTRENLFSEQIPFLSFSFGKLKCVVIKR